jgi:hypothetical protein
MREATSFVVLAGALALMSSGAFAEHGDSSSWGSYGWGACEPHAVAHAKRPSI